MSLQSANEFNSLGVGPGGMGSFGGLGGGIGLVGLFGLLNGRHGGLFGGGGEGDGCGKEVAILSAIRNSQDATASEIREVVEDICSVKDKICEVKDNIKDALYAQTIQGIQNTEAIKAQAQAFQLSTSAQFDALSREGERNTALIIAKLNQTELDNLRDELHSTRRRSDNKDIEISINNSNQQQQSQLQLQSQWLAGAIDRISGQINKSNNDILNLGSGSVFANQEANQANTRVRS